MEKKHLVLIGFMGSGKSTIGSMLSKKLNMPMVDTDQLIEKQNGCKISTIFEKKGEQAFRLMETELLHQLHEAEKPMIISTGGGLPLKEENAALLKQIGQVFFLDASKETVIRRLHGDTTRPLLRGDHVEEKVETLLKNRREYYLNATDFVIDVNRDSIQQIVNTISMEFERSQNAID